MIRTTRSTRFAFVVALLLLACEGTRVTPDAVAVPPPKRVPTVVFITDKGEVPVLVDIAKTPTQREQGLMWVEHMADNRGMVFLMGPERILSFWMKNTYIPLDMIFVNTKMEVVGVVANAEPHTLDPRRVDAPSSYVVEVNAGWAERNGVRAGTKVRFEAID